MNHSAHLDSTIYERWQPYIWEPVTTVVQVLVHTLDLNLVKRCCHYKWSTTHCSEWQRQLNGKWSINEHSNPFAPCDKTQYETIRWYWICIDLSKEAKCSFLLPWFIVENVSYSHTAHRFLSSTYPRPARTGTPHLYSTAREKLVSLRRNFNLLQPCHGHKLCQQGGSVFCLGWTNRVNGQGHGERSGGY